MIKLCGIGVHKWSKWTEPYTITVKIPTGLMVVNQEYIVQDSTCIHCNKIVRRKVTPLDDYVANTGWYE